MIAEDGTEALAMLARKDVDIVLMDVHMPGMDGMEATRLIRQHEDTRIRQVPVIALTASIMQDQRARYLEAGMNDVLAKPIEIERVNHTMATLLENRRPRG